MGQETPEEIREDLQKDDATYGGPETVREAQRRKSFEIIYGDDQGGTEPPLEPEPPELPVEPEPPEQSVEPEQPVPSEWYTDPPQPHADP